MLNDKTYDIMKRVCTIILPAIQAFWLTLGDIWNFPYYTQIGATIAAVTIFMGACLEDSNSQYKAELKAMYESEQDEFGEEGLESGVAEEE